MVVELILKCLQRYCHHDYEYLGRFRYPVSQRHETVWFCNRCADTLAAQPAFGSDSFRYSPAS